MTEEFLAKTREDRSLLVSEPEVEIELLKEEDHSLRELEQIEVALLEEEEEQP